MLSMLKKINKETRRCASQLIIQPAFLHAQPNGQADRQQTQY